MRLRRRFYCFIVATARPDASRQTRLAVDKLFASAAPIYRCNDRTGWCPVAGRQSLRRCDPRARKW